MVDIKGEYRLRKISCELLRHARFPAVSEIGLGVHVFREKTVLVRNAEEIEHRGDHIKVGNQDALGEVLAEILVTAGDPVPKLRGGFTQNLGIDLVEVGADLKPFVNLIGTELPDGNTADELSKRLLAQAQVDIRNLHKESGYHGKAALGRMSPEFGSSPSGSYAGVRGTRVGVSSTAALALRQFRHGSVDVLYTEKKALAAVNARFGGFEAGRHHAVLGGVGGDLVAHQQSVVELLPEQGHVLEEGLRVGLGDDLAVVGLTVGVFHE